MRIKREWNDRLHTVEEHSKRCLARAHEEADTKLRAIAEERDRLALRLGVDPDEPAPGGPGESLPEIPDDLPDFAEPGQLLPAARLRPLRPRSGRSASATSAAGPDDLKRIKGVGPAYERALHELGYTTYASIARLDQREITDLSNRFGGRARPAEWAVQAAELSKEREQIGA